ncbi:hypothetical protein MRX96_047862 [Rhipicephalus microplus]
MQISGSIKTANMTLYIYAASPPEELYPWLPGMPQPLKRSTVLREDGGQSHTCASSSTPSSQSEAAAEQTLLSGFSPYGSCLIGRKGRNEDETEKKRKKKTAVVRSDEAVTPHAGHVARRD